MDARMNSAPTFTRAVFRDVTEWSTSAGTITVDLSSSQHHELTLNQSCVITLDAPTGYGTYTLVIKENGTGGYTPTFAVGTFTAGGTQPVMGDTTANAWSIFSVFVNEDGISVLLAGDDMTALT